MENLDRDPCYPYLSRDPHGTLHFDVPVFLRTHGFEDTPINRDRMARVALEVFRKTWPRTAVAID